MPAIPLEQIIWQVLACVPPGQVATYGQIARLAGYPRHARFVGSALSRLPSDSRLPWFRVIKAGGALAFPPDSPQYQRQRSLLEAEAIPFLGERVLIRRCQWQAGR